MQTINREEAFARRRTEAQVTLKELKAGGRGCLKCVIGGNARAYIWAKRGDRSVPVAVELVRLYSTPEDWGSSRGLEAGDMGDAIACLSAAEQTLVKWRVPLVAPAAVSEEARLGGRRLKVATVQRPRLAEEAFQGPGDLEHIVEDPLGHGCALEPSRGEAQDRALDGVAFPHSEPVQDELLGFRRSAGLASAREEEVERSEPELAQLHDVRLHNGTA